jgi:hypothetical protein
MNRHQTQREYFHALLEERIGHYQRSCRWYGRRRNIFSLATVFLSAMITLVAGLKSAGMPAWFQMSDDGASNVVLFLGACASIVAAWSGFFSPRDNWCLHAETCAKLRALEAKATFDESGPDFAASEVQVMAGHFAEFQKIMETHSGRWREILQRSASQTAHP